MPVSFVIHSWHLWYALVALLTFCIITLLYADDLPTTTARIAMSVVWPTIPLFIVGALLLDMWDNRKWGAE